MVFRCFVLAAGLCECVPHFCGCMCVENAFRFPPAAAFDSPHDPKSDFLLRSLFGGKSYKDNLFPFDSKASSVPAKKKSFSSRKAFTPCFSSGRDLEQLKLLPRRMKWERELPVIAVKFVVEWKKNRTWILSPAFDFAFLLKWINPNNIKIDSLKWIILSVLACFVCPASSSAFSFMLFEFTGINNDDYQVFALLCFHCCSFDEQISSSVSESRWEKVSLFSHDNDFSSCYPAPRFVRIRQCH